MLTYDFVSNEFSDGSKLLWRVGASPASARVALPCGKELALGDEHLDAELEFFKKMTFVVPVYVGDVIIEQIEFDLEQGATLSRFLSLAREAFDAPLSRREIERYKDELDTSLIESWQSALARLDATETVRRLDVAMWAAVPSPWLDRASVELNSRHRVACVFTSSSRPSRTSTT